MKISRSESETSLSDLQVPRTTDIPAFLDFEAVVLDGRSYPIEIAWVSPTGEVKSFLINPEGVRGWDFWSEGSEEIHGITREELSEHGLAPAVVAAKLLEDLGAGQLYSDYPVNDGRWLRQLFEAAGVEQNPFLVKDMLSIPALRDLDVLKRGAIERQVREQFSVRHRAGVDVQAHVATFRLAQASQG